MKMMNSILFYIFLSVLLPRVSIGQDIKPLLEMSKKLVIKIDEKCSKGIKPTEEHLEQVTKLCLEKYVSESATPKWPVEFYKILDCWNGVADPSLKSKTFCDADKRKKGVQCSMGKLFNKMAIIRKFYKDNKSAVDEQINEAKDCSEKFLESIKA